MSASAGQLCRFAPKSLLPKTVFGSRHFAEMSASPFRAEKPASEAGFGSRHLEKMSASGSRHFPEADISPKCLLRLFAPKNEADIFAKMSASSNNKYTLSL